MPDFDPAKTRSARVFKHPETFLAVAADHATGMAYSASYDRAIHRYDLSAENPGDASKDKSAGKADDKTQTAVRWEKHESYVSTLALTRSGGKTVLVSGGFDRAMIWWNAQTGEVLRHVPAHDGWVRDLAPIPGTNLIASVGDDMLVKIWDLDSGQLVRTLEGHAKRTPQGHVTALYVVAAAPDGKSLATADRIGDVRLWDVETGKPLGNFQTPILYTYDERQRKRSIGGIRALAFSPDGKMLAVGGVGQIGNVDGLGGPAHVEIWDWRAPRRIVATGVEKQNGLVNHLAFHPTAPYLVGAGGGDGGFLAFWKTDSLAPAASPGPIAPDADEPGDASANDKRIVKDAKPSAKKDGDGLPAHRVKGDGHVHHFQFNADATRIYAAGFGRLEVWSLIG